jgi:hypothetical protein
VIWNTLLIADLGESDCFWRKLPHSSELAIVGSWVYNRLSASKAPGRGVLHWRDTRHPRLSARSISCSTANAPCTSRQKHSQVLVTLGITTCSGSSDAPAPHYRCCCYGIVHNPSRTGPGSGQRCLRRSISVSDTATAASFSGFDVLMRFSRPSGPASRTLRPMLP